MKQAMKNSNKSSAPGLNCITVELIENEVSSYFTALPISCSYFLGYFPKSWKKENRINLKKPDKQYYHLGSSYHSISLPNILVKIY